MTEKDFNNKARFSDIPLGLLVRDRVTGLVGVAENCASFFYGCDRYFVQPRLPEGSDKLPEGIMVDRPQLEVLPVVDQVPHATRLFAVASLSPVHQLGQQVRTRLSLRDGVVMGRAVYLNGCIRCLVQWDVTRSGKVTTDWVDEGGLRGLTTWRGKPKMVANLRASMKPKPKTADQRVAARFAAQTTPTTQAHRGGPAPSCSKY
jgi:hypothetical protein